MDRYGTGAVEDESEPDAIDDGDDREDQGEAVDVSAEVIGYAETRRWFEGTVNVDEDDIPNFDEPPPEEAAEVKPPVRALAPPAILHLPKALPSAFALVADASIKASSMIETPKPSLAAESRKSDEAPMELDDLVTLLRSRSAPLPAFATEEFLDNAIHMVPRDTRLMHDDREWIRKATGFPWPEERPAVEDMPRLYEEALRYPAFAIVFQHQFFPDDNNRGGRGLPKNQIIARNSDAWKRLRMKGPIPKGVSGVPSSCASCIASRTDATRNPNSPSSWSAGARRVGREVLEGDRRSEKLEAEGGEWTDLAKYLRAVFGPFRQFGPDRTIGEIMEEVVIPQAMKQMQIEAAPVAEPPEQAGSAVEPDTEAPVVALEADEIREPVDDLVAIEDEWQREWEKLMALAGIASANGPQGGTIEEIRASLSILEDLRDRAGRLVPLTVPTADLREDLRRLTAKAAELLNSLLGEEWNAPELLSRLFDLPEQAREAEVVSANSLRIEADAAMAEADAGAEEIERLEATLPRKLARAQALTIDEVRERALRRVLQHVGAAIDVFPKKADASASTPTNEEPVEEPIAAVALPVPVADEPPATAAPAAVPAQPAEIAVTEAPQELGDELMLDVDVNELPVTSPATTVATEVIDEVAEDPLLKEITARLDALFALGEFGLAYHLRRCARSVLPPSPDVYTEDELRLAAADGRAMGLSGQDVQFLTSSRSETLTVAQSLAGLDDDRSIARLTMLLASAIPAALFRPDDGAAVPLVEAITSLKPFEHLRNAFTIVEENRRFNFPLTAANLMAIEAHSRESSFVSDAVASIKDTVAGLRSAKFRFQYGERVKTALLQPQGLLGRLLSGLTETSHDVASEVSERLRGREDILRLIDSVGTEGASQEVDLQARERIFVALSRVGQQCADLVRALEGLTRSASRRSDWKRSKGCATPRSRRSMPRWRGPARRPAPDRCGERTCRRHPAIRERHPEGSFFLRQECPSARRRAAHAVAMASEHDLDRR